MGSAQEGIYHFTLGQRLLEKASKELNENDQFRARDIQCLRERVEANKALTCPTDDFYLLKFLRAAKFDYDKTYQRLLNFHRVRAKNWDVYSRMLPSQISNNVLRDGVTIVLPSKDKEGRHVILFRPGQWSCTEYSVFELHNATLMNMEMILEDEEATINGFIVLIDFAGTSPTMVTRFDARESKMITTMLQDAFPIRFKGAYCVNAPSIFSMVHSIMKPFLKQKTKARIHFVKDVEALHRVIDPSALPEDYRGTLPPADVLAQKWKRKLIASEVKFALLPQHRLVLDRKICDRKDDDIVKNIVGTFRKLDV